MTCGNCRPILGPSSHGDADAVPLMSKEMVVRIVLSLFAITLGLATTSGADDGLIIGGNSKQFWVQDAKKVYDSACSTVQHEFRISTPVRPRLTLIVGASENKASVEPRGIRLTKWDPYLFAQGVVIF